MENAPGQLIEIGNMPEGRTRGGLRHQLLECADNLAECVHHAEKSL
jgi:hypothetical protein